MNPTEFIYWLQGALEICNVETLTKEQVQVIKDHIKLVLTKVTPETTKKQTPESSTTSDLRFPKLPVDYSNVRVC